MRRSIENKYAVLGILLLFVLASAGFTNNGGNSLPADHIQMISEAVTVSHGPLTPPDPWVGNVTVAHGPLTPPDPWVGNVTVAHGPLTPPDPWIGNVTVAHGPLTPPDPWVGNLSAAIA